MIKLPLLLPLATAALVAQQATAPPKLPNAPAVGVEKDLSPVPHVGAIEAPTAADEDVRAAAFDAFDKEVTTAAAGALTARLRDPSFFAFDEPGDGSVWAVGRSYKVSFSDRDFRFFGRPSSIEVPASPIDFRLEQVAVAGEPIALSAAERRRVGDVVEFDRGALVERVHVSGHGVEQTFTFDELPRRGELVVRVAVESALVAAVDDGDGAVHFRGPHDDVRVSPAVAFDARGRSVAAATTCEDGALTIRVPASFVEQAALPLVIDPWIHAIQVSSSTNDLGDPDIAWDETGQVWAVVYGRVFAAGDWDCYVQRVSLGNPMTLVGTPTVIDASSTSWQRPRIANLGVYDVFLVVAQTRLGTGTWKIQGRVMANSGPTVSAQVTIASSFVDEIRPDVGGDPGSPPTYFTVAWEHSYSATDHDIYARQVEPTGALRGSSPIYVQTNTLNQSWPSISKSCGGGSFASQRFAIVYSQGTPGSSMDVYGSMLTWDGQFVPVNGVNTFPIDTSGGYDVFPAVSTPTLPGSNGRRQLLAVYQRNFTNATDIVATCFDHTGVVRASANVTLLEQSAFRVPWPQQRPSVDSDGLRFVVGYDEVWNNNTTINDLDTRATVVALSGSSLIAEEAGTTLGFSSNREFNLQIASRYSGSGLYSRHFNTANDRDGVSGGGFAIDAYSFDATPQGAFTTRPTACGTVTMGHSGTAIPGGFVTFTHSASSPLSGFVLGAPTSSPIGGCACTLGVDGYLVLGASTGVSIPNDPALVGAGFAAQAFVYDFQSGVCLGAIQVSTTTDVLVQ